MKRRAARIVVLTVLLAVAYGCFPNIAAKERDSSQDSGFEKYELSFSGAFLPGRWAFGYDFLYSGTHSSIPEIYRDYAYREKEFSISRRSLLERNSMSTVALCLFCAKSNCSCVSKSISPIG